AEVLGQDRLQLRGLEAVAGHEPDLEDFDPVSPVALDRGRAADSFEAAQVGLPATADEPDLQRVGLLGLDPAPETRAAPRTDSDRVAHVPLELQTRVGLAEQGDQPRQQTAVPLRRPARREPLVAEVPLLAVLLPGHVPLDAARRGRSPAADDLDGPGE